MVCVSVCVYCMWVAAYIHILWDAHNTSENTTIHPGAVVERAGREYKTSCRRGGAPRRLLLMCCCREMTCWALQIYTRFEYMNAGRLVCIHEWNMRSADVRGTLHNINDRVLYIRIGSRMVWCLNFPVFNVVHLTDVDFVRFLLKSNVFICFPMN